MKYKIWQNHIWHYSKSTYDLKSKKNIIPVRFELPNRVVMFNVFGKKISTKKNCSLKCTNWMLSLQSFCFSFVYSSNVFLIEVVAGVVYIFSKLLRLGSRGGRRGTRQMER